MVTLEGCLLKPSNILVILNASQLLLRNELFAETSNLMQLFLGLHSPWVLFALNKKVALSPAHPISLLTGIL